MTISRMAPFCLLIALISTVIATPTANAISYSETFMTPEIQYQRELSQKIRISKQINLNQASMNELKTLPGVDENVALKIIRIRPIENVRDIQRLPWMNTKEIQQLIQGLQGRIRF